MEEKYIIQADIFAGHFTSPQSSWTGHNDSISCLNPVFMQEMIGVRVGDSDVLFSKIDDLKVFETFLEGVTCSAPLPPKIRSRVLVDGALLLIDYIRLQLYYVYLPKMNKKIWKSSVENEKIAIKNTIIFNGTVLLMKCAIFSDSTKGL
ncbi:hypothetical protein X798_03369 [Onchocerca flexuosa]|uniref:Uncharacterized protein n=1 Tax=Onchocerca flexuosa TaxID=387005 RepID=A0A238BY45_9BILA|nr:hypothetical protein X798_03369 [Onchocerca flexuosa]